MVFYLPSCDRGHLAGMFSRQRCDGVSALLGLLALAPAHGMLLPLPRVAARQAVTASSASSAAQCFRRAQRCGGVWCQVFPGDFAQQSDQEEDEAGDAARAVLRARRAIGGALPPDERPSQEWSEGVLDGAAPVSRAGPVAWPGCLHGPSGGYAADWPRLAGARGGLRLAPAPRAAFGESAGQSCVPHPFELAEGLGRVSRVSRSYMVAVIGGSLAPASGYLPPWYPHSSRCAPSSGERPTPTPDPTPGPKPDYRALTI